MILKNSQVTIYQWIETFVCLLANYVYIKHLAISFYLFSQLQVKSCSLALQLFAKIKKKIVSDFLAYFFRNLESPFSIGLQ